MATVLTTVLSVIANVSGNSTHLSTRQYSSQSRPCCLDGWLAYEDSCYLVTQMSKKHWIEARQFCLDNGGDLFVRNSLEEWNLILEFIPAQSFAWIGLSMHTWTPSGQLDQFHHYVGDLCSYCFEYVRLQQVYKGADLDHTRMRRAANITRGWRNLFYRERQLSAGICRWIQEPEPHLVLNHQYGLAPRWERDSPENATAVLPWLLRNLLFNGWKCTKDCAAVHVKDNPKASYVDWHSCHEQSYFICERNATAVPNTGKQWTCC